MQQPQQLHQQQPRRQQRRLVDHVNWSVKRALLDLISAVERKTAKWCVALVLSVRIVEILMDSVVMHLVRKMPLATVDSAFVTLALTLLCLAASDYAKQPAVMKSQPLQQRLPQRLPLQLQPQQQPLLQHQLAEIVT